MARAQIPFLVYTINMTKSSSDSDHGKHVGRDSRVDLAKYTVQVREADSLFSAQTPQKPATAKYFYTPVFTSEPGKGSFESSVLVFGDKNPLYYASRVLPGQTLQVAIAADLQKDFNYFGDFEILQHRYYDAAQDKQGDQLPRLLVQIATDRFATAGLQPVGVGVHWAAGQAFLSSLGLLEWIPHIPFHKFFDPEKEHDFIDGFVALKSKKLNYDDTQFLFKNNKTNELYVAIESDLGNDIDSVDSKTLTVWLGTDMWKLDQVKALYPDWFATHLLYHVKI